MASYTLSNINQVAADKADDLVKQAKAEAVIHSERAAQLTLEVAHLDDVVQAGNAQCDAVTARLAELRAEQARVESIIAEAKARLGA